MNKKTLSVVVPAYNEEKTILQILQKVKALKLPDGYSVELVVVDDCSKDGTRDVVEGFIQNNDNTYLLRNETNLGKTQSVKRGIAKTTGEYVILQDADLEYDVNDILEMFNFILKSGDDVVYGDRFHGLNTVLYKGFYFGNRFISVFSNLFTYPRIRTWIPDVEVCYKLVKGDLMREIASRISSTSSFGFEPEITARLSRYKVNGKHLTFGIVPIKYFPRSVEEGKKIRYTDGLKAIVEIIKYNIL